jgi:hypothetical protein
MHLPETEHEALAKVMAQAEYDLQEAHKEICRLAGLDDMKHTWPVWSSPAHTLQWFAAIRAKFGIEPASTFDPASLTSGYRDSVEIVESVQPFSGTEK